MPNVSKEFLTELLRKAGFSETAIEIYWRIKSDNWHLFNGDAMAEMYLVLLDCKTSSHPC